MEWYLYYIKHLIFYKNIYQKARATYQWLIDLTDDVDLQDSLKFLREREVNHSQRFREAIEILKFESDRKQVF
ncbi:hypothetical protein ERL59_04665 [Chengkuizengella sp. YPA3-1-1]|uniref:Manganese containing catalase n=1 Tax=Chengkuizengella marina TaxID=2507566 RepID=A0A6N9PZ42_9BACL|nr:hypothetical protein [Chengkuizengella marina]